MGQSGSVHVVSKRFVNDPRDIMNDTLEGLIWSNPDLSRLDGPGWIIVRSDWDKDVQGKSQVAVVTSSEGGHEPGDMGLIGKGVLTAVACGDIFAAPSAEALAHMLEAVTGEAGCLILAKNYIGHRLNCGMAVKRVTSRQRQFRVHMVTVLDDIVPQLLDGGETLDQKSIAGTTLVAKIAGAAAEDGQPLDAVCSAAQDAANAVSTLGVCFQGGSRPGVRNPYPVGEDQMEIGRGVNGEPGHAKLQARANATAKQIVTKLVTSLGQVIPTEGPLCVLLNNLGAVPMSEMYILAKEVMVSELGHRIELFCGPAHYLTSLDSNGISLSVLALTAQRSKYLLAPCSCVAWRPPVSPRFDVPGVAASLVSDHTPKSENNTLAPTFPAYRRESTATESSVCSSRTLAFNRQVSGQTDLLEGVLKRCCEVLRIYEDELGELSGIVDGNAGHNLASVANAMLRDLDGLVMLADDPGQLLWEVAKFMRSGSGALPALFSILISNASEYFTECNITEWSQPSVSAAFRQGLKAVEDVGCCKEGSSFLDAFLPALIAAESGANMETIASEARKGARATELHHHGEEARYVAPMQVRSTADPGAIVVALLFTAMATPVGGRFYKIGDDVFRTTLFAFFEVVGEGAFGTVYATSRRDADGKETEGPATLAVKASRRGEETGLEEFGRLDVLDKQVLINWLFTDKRHIIKVYDVGISFNHVYLVMDRLHGPTVEKWLEESTDISEVQAGSILRQILIAIRSIHSHNMVHRDLKPGNFAFKDPGCTEVVLIDIAGTMCIVQAGRRADEVGTPAYMAPEELNHGEVTTSIDMWAVGVLTYFMLSGRLPYKGSSFAEYAEAQENEKPDFSSEPWPAVSAHAIDFINLCLTLDPLLRLTVTEALKHPWVTEFLPPDHSPPALSKKALGLRRLPSNPVQEGELSKAQSVFKTLFLIRHGEAEHNILEKQAQEQAAAEAIAGGIVEGSKAYKDRLEEARQEILRSDMYRDAELSTKGKQMALNTKAEMMKLVGQHGYPSPAGVLVSPLRRTLETAAALFPDHPGVHVRDLLRERQTGYACDERSFAEEMQARPEFSHMSFNKLLTIDRRRTWYLTTVKENKQDLRKRSALLGELLRPLDADAIAIVSHKGFLRELERGPLKRGEDWPEFGNCELRVYDMELMSDGRMSAKLRYAPRLNFVGPLPPSPGGAETQQLK